MGIAYFVKLCFERGQNQHVITVLQYGLGKHMWNVPLEPDFYPIWMLDDFLTQVFFVLAVTMSRSAILLFYLRIFITRDMKWAIWSSLALVVSIGTSSLFVVIFSCDPVSASWRLADIPTAKCINRPVFYYAVAGLFIVMDLLTISVPMPKLKSLRMPLKQKIGVGVMLVLGSGACIVSIYRLHSISVIQADTDLSCMCSFIVVLESIMDSANRKSDVTTPGMMWCILEINLSIIGGSMPTLKPFLQRHAPRLLSLSQSKGGSSNANDKNIARSRSHFGRLEGDARSPAWKTTTGTTASCSMSRSRGGDSSLSPVKSNDTDELPLQGAIKKTIYYGYELEEGTSNISPSKHEYRVRPVLPPFVRDLEAEDKVRQHGW